MGCQNQKRRRLICALAVLLAAAPTYAQKGQTDSLVRLMQAQSIELVEKGGQPHRKTIDATFLHNGTYLICDTALWNVNDKLIHCWGNVKLVQEETSLTSDRLDYIIDDNLAQFRGEVVQLKNKQGNLLRTRNLDYNTKDSLATFMGGAAMHDEDGQVIESRSGTYKSNTNFFDFTGDVNMYTDSVFVKTTHLTYDAEKDEATFPAYIDFWKDGNMLSAGNGWYNRNSGTFFFRRNVHALSQDQEAWSDSLYFYNGPQNVLMLGHAQVQDTTRNVFALANYIFYEDSLSRVTMRRDAAVAMRTEQEEKVDTLYVGADDLTYWTTRMCDIPESEIGKAKTRLEEIMGDSVLEYRRRAAKEAADAAAEAAAENPEARARLAAEKIKAGQNKGSQPAKDEKPAEVAANDSAAAELPDSLLLRDSLALPDSLAITDSLALADSLAVNDTVAIVLPPPDTTEIGFLRAMGRVRMFRTDMQVRCDSLVYCDLDSLARLFKSPIVWNDGNRQYTSDSLFVLVKNGGIDRASLMSNAFIITQEDSLCYDQIKGTDVLAYFDEDSQLRRFDALGGASALFYLQENEAFSTVNKVESKMLSANLKEGNLEKVFYFDAPKNNAYPIVQLPEEERRMKGFNWNPDDRPKDRTDITPLEIIPSERTSYEARPKAVFKQTDIYFPGYMSKIYNDLEAAKARKRQAREQQQAMQDSLAALPDTLAASDSLSAPVDSLAAAAEVIDSLATQSPVAASDSLAAEQTAVEDAVATLSDKELKQQKRQDRKEALETARALRIARRDARWAELDAKDAAKAEAKAQKELEKKRQRTLKEALRQRKQDIKDEKRLSEYIKRYEKHKPIETSNEQDQEESGGSD